MVPVTSERKIAANRTNGRKSRGPRTRAGKARASRNAYRHGLTTINRSNPTHFEAIELLAQAMCDGEDDAIMLEEARVIAECDLLLRFIKQERVTLIERLSDVMAVAATGRDRSLALARERMRQGYAAYDALVQQEGDINDLKKMSSAAMQNRSKPSWPKGIRFDRQRDEFDAMLAAMPDLIRLDRYERRAWSRRKRAVREFIAIKSNRCVGRSRSIEATETTAPGQKGPP